MNHWFLILLSISISISVSGILRFIVNRYFINTKPTVYKLPPSPKSIPVISNLLWLRRISPSNIHSILNSLHAKLGPIITIYLGSRPLIFIADRLLAHKALIQNGAVFANRPPASATQKLVTSNQRNVSLAFYGPIWRLLRRNLTENFLHPSCAKSFSHSRRWALQVLKNRLASQEKSGQPICVREHFQYAMFCLLVVICFGDNVDENQIKQIEEVQRRVFLSFNKFNILNLWPRVTKIVLRRRWEEFYQLRKCQLDVSIPLIRTRKNFQEEDRESMEPHHDRALCYVDTLLSLEFPDEERKINEEEIANLCSEFLNAGTDTTTTSLEWIMANLVKYPKIQDRLFMEIKEVVGDGDQEEVSESDLKRMPYLKAVVLEGLRRHPPARLLIPHAVMEDVVLNNEYLIPKNAAINFLVAEMGWDPEAWEDPLTFKPERFLDHDNGTRQEFDITGSREIKMMPFGAGRRICPGYQLGMLHLEYYVANLVCKFEWRAVDGDDVDLSERTERTMVMKNPLRVRISPR
ncbi:cytochrome P450 89A2 [Populus alba]|uniref:Cytochrome P450 89A2-like n=1 Tax=Populus alba TaxID=43335 RepID=A0A4U5NA95_POPAL|nr:cytochrome P450 89A2-like [Populus alba]TKR79544.1 cytochrome P450 89A2-like [Populus alba]